MKANQKLKIMYLMKILLEKTDAAHSLTMKEIIAELEQYGISCERKSIYSDIESLRAYGMDIIGEQVDQTYCYYVGNRQFELAELKLLVDSVQASKYITEKKSNELIKKIEGLASKYEASRLQRQVYVAGRVKAMNESIYYNVDKIQTAIGSNSKITFQYFQWDVNKQMVLRRGGGLYEISPWRLALQNENYYLIAFDAKAGIIKYFRVDKMLNIELTYRSREGGKQFGELDPAIYEQRRFDMYDGKEEIVNIVCENSMAGIFIDRFGKNVMFIKVDEQHFQVNVKVAVSRQFLAWVMALGEGVRIVGPDSVVEQVRKELERLVCVYSQ